MGWWRLSSWVRIRFEHLRRWREYAESIARAARDILGEAVEVYVIGGVAEGRTTVLSDIDILIVADMLPRDRKRLYGEILERAIDVYGLPWDAPVELHITDKKRAEEYLKGGKHERIEISAK
jgi:predicted nucleotidyltransferase